MLYMFKSSVMAIIMATNIFGGSCSNENVKVEDVTPTNEVVMEEENIIEELIHYWGCDTLPKFVHIYEMIIPDGDEEPLCLKLQNSYSLQLTEEEKIEKFENWYD